MNRIALLIGSPLQEDHPKHLSGAIEDLNNYRTFLMSSVGGGWHEDEIITLLNPTLEDVSLFIDFIVDYDIALVLFSGHGHLRNGRQFVRLNEWEEMPVSYLRTDALRQITIIDSCRKEVPHYSYFEGDISGTGIEFDFSHLEHSRKVYDYLISQAPLGHVTIFSSAKNQLSLDTQEGGMYSVSLLRSIVQWYYSGDSDYLKIGSAFGRALRQLTRAGSRQRPKGLVNGENALKIPIAVNVKEFARKVKRARIRNERRASPLLTLTGTLVGIILLDRLLQ